MAPAPWLCRQCSRPRGGRAVPTVDAVRWAGCHRCVRPKSPDRPLSACACSAAFSVEISCLQPRAIARVLELVELFVAQGVDASLRILMSTPQLESLLHCRRGRSCRHAERATGAAAAAFAARRARCCRSAVGRRRLVEQRAVETTTSGRRAQSTPRLWRTQQVGFRV